MVENKDLTFVIQGDRRRRICKCVAKIRKYFPNSHIIFSTWAGTDVSDIDCDEAVFSIDPGDSGDVYAPDNVENLSHKNNLNRQIVSSYAGLKKVRTLYAVKLRPDFIFHSNAIQKIYSKCLRIKQERDPKWKMFENKIMMFCPANPHTTQLAYHVCDYFQIGHTKDLVEFWNIPLQRREDAQYCVINNVVHPQRLRAYRYACEQEIWLRNLDKFNIQYKKPSVYYDVDEEIIEDSESSFLNNLYFLEYAKAEVSSPFNWLKDERKQWAYKCSDCVLIK